MAGGNQNHILAFSQLRGGIAIHNPNSDPNVAGGAYGTLGFIATSDGTDRWAVSCYHVLCRKGADFPKSTTEPIFHPFSQLHPSPIAVIKGDRANRKLDCAAAQILDPSLTIGQVLGIGKLSAPIPAALGMRVLKAGAETGVTEGRIVKVAGDEVEIAPLGFSSSFDLSEGGDSGSLWIDAATHAPVALHYKGSERGTPERAFGKLLQPVLATLNLQLVID